MTGRRAVLTVRAARVMNIHEYQAKILFDQFEVPNPRGMVATTAEEAAAADDAADEAVDDDTK